MKIINIASNLIYASVGGLVYIACVTIYVKYNFNLTLDTSDSEVRFFVWFISAIIYFILEYLDGRKLSWYLKLI